MEILTVYQTHVIGHMKVSNYYYTFIDTTLLTIYDRWNKLVLPINTDQQEVDRISKQVENVIRHKWAAQEQTDDLRNQLGNIVT